LVTTREQIEQTGLLLGEVEAAIDDTALARDPAIDVSITSRDGRLFLGAAGAPISDETVQSLRDGQK
jgi:hypothetical protein